MQMTNFSPIPCSNGVVRIFHVLHGKTVASSWSEVVSWHLQMLGQQDLTLQWQSSTLSDWYMRVDELISTNQDVFFTLLDPFGCSQRETPNNGIHGINGHWQKQVLGIPGMDRNRKWWVWQETRCSFRALSSGEDGWGPRSALGRDLGLGFWNAQVQKGFLFWVPDYKVLGTSTTVRFRVEEKRICSAEEMSTHHCISLFA